ncbi:hypothetical protein DL96DRAFT_1709747 [Flagelloscypha sp. PMI_526]|nr:hypothetical protein DL96DRAFT_1709747 [Flagelloscypha sp. PMI_526]
MHLILDKSPTLDLHDPSTPGKRRYARSPADSPVLSSKSADKPELRTHSSSPTPKLSVQTDSDSPSGSPIIPARSSSLNSSPTRTVHRPASQGSLGVTTGNSTVRPKGGPRSSIQGPRDLNRLRVLHRSAASNSEPSLVSNGDDGPSSLGSSNHSGSQQDLSSSQSNLTTLPSSSSSQSLVRSDDGDLDSQGKEYATRCFNEDEDFKAKEKIAEWLGGEKALNQAALQYYMEFFDFTGLRLDMAFRRLCAKLYLKAETQQVDRILEQFSRRYWKCNPASLYGSSNIVHAVSYSMLLLNTDLHVADVANRMTRREFVNNTLSAIQEQLRAPQRERTTSMSSLGHKMAPTPPSRGSGSGSNNTSMENVATITARTHRSDSVNSWTSVSREVPLSSSPVAISQATFTPGHHSNGSNVSMQASASGHGGETRSSTGPQYGRAWETDMEGVLKEMYNAIKSQQILQPLGSGPARLSTSSLSPGGSTIRRNQSLRGPPDRLATLKRGSIRGIQSILGQQQGSSPYSSNSSIEGRVSPSPSFAASTHEALYGSSSSFLTPTLGFASNLSHTIIRETQEDHDDDLGSEESAGSDSTTISISDEELALLGAPWAKEGMLCRKQYWEASGKRAKDKTWLDVFVVIQKGELNMFTFGDHGSGGRSMFGGGNWLANADAVGTVHLAHSLAHALPPPGYNRQRPYCMVLTLANGGVYFFQAGTEELVNEWVSTCNYWAARTSKEPLAGGVSNMEYGWNRVSDPMHGRSQSDSGDATSVTDDFSDAMSVKSGRSSKSKYGWRDGAATVRGSSSPYSDRVFINDWKPPMHPTVSSMHDEETQMEALQKHVATMKKDIKRHNELREPMLAMYQPRSSNCVKAQSNWEKKSRFLLAEIVKYDSYVESLKAAMSLRLKKRGEKALERALRGTSPAADESAAPWKGKGVDADDDDADLNEPTTPAATVQSHRRHPADDS